MVGQLIYLWRRALTANIPLQNRSTNYHDGHYVKPDTEVRSMDGEKTTYSRRLEDPNSGTDRSLTEIVTSEVVRIGDGASKRWIKPKRLWE